MGEEAFGCLPETASANCRAQVLEINCSGTLISLPKAALCSIEGTAPWGGPEEVEGLPEGRTVFHGVAHLVENGCLDGAPAGSYLNHMFSDAFVQSVPRDKEAACAASLWVNSVRKTGSSQESRGAWLDWCCQQNSRQHSLLDSCSHR